MNESSYAEGSESKTPTLALVRRNPWISRIAAFSSLATVAALVVAGFLQHFFLAYIALNLLVLIAALVGMLWIRNPRPREIEGAVSVHEEGVRIGQALVLPREQIKAGFVVPRPGKRPIVRLENKKRLALPTEIRVENDDDGREVLRRLGLDATQTIASFVLPSRLFADPKLGQQYMMGMGTAFVLTAILTRSSGLYPEVFPVLIGLIGMSFGVTALLTRTHLRIGADGIVLKWFRTERFIPYDEIASIESYEEKEYRRRWAGAKVHLHSGETIKLPIASAGDIGGPRVRLVKHRLEQAHADHQRGARASAEARLVRGERPMLAWVRELRRAGAGAAANHRIAPVPTDRLLELAEDPHADPIMRANAAVALGANTESGEIRTRLRVAAQATAAPRLRVALEKSVDVDDEAALAEALAEVEAEAKKTLPNP